MKALKRSPFVYFIYSLAALFVIGAPGAYGESLQRDFSTSTKVSPSSAKSQTSFNYKLIEVSKTIENMRRQESLSKAAEKRGLIPSTKISQPQNIRILSDGGPGMDGGGGETVLTADGRLRLLDLALSERLPLKPFDKDSYLAFMSQRGNYVSNIGRYVAPTEFFRCASELLGRQDNALLQYLRPENLDMLVVLTDLPLNQSEPHLSQVTFESPFGAGYPYEVTQLPKETLASTSLPLSYQRPVASYAFQSVDMNWYPRQTLIVSSQLYANLSEKDRCALQVHEIFRYVSNFGSMWKKNMAPLLTKALSSREIEILTVKILNNQPVYLSEIPATDILKSLAVAGQGSLKNLLELDPKYFAEIEQRLISAGVVSEEIPYGFAKTMELLKGLGLPEEQSFIETVMSETDEEDLTHHGKARLRYQKQKLKGQIRDLRSLILD